MELEKGVFVDGCFHWWVRGERRLLCFDVREGTLMELRVPDEVKEVDQEKDKIKVTEVAGRLCLYSKSKDWKNLRVWEMDKYDGSDFGCWKELVKMEGEKQELGSSCLANEDYVVCMTNGSKSLEFSRFLVYSDYEKKFDKIDGCWSDVRYQNHLPFTETLFSPTKHLHPRKWSHPQPQPLQE